MTPQVDHAALEQAVYEYVVTIDELHGFFIDSLAGFQQNYLLIERLQRETVANRVIPAGANPDENTIRYGKGPPDQPGSSVQHITTQGEYKARNRIGGRNHVRAAQLIIVLIYEYWESEYRTRIASAVCMDRNALTIPVFGDLRLLRHDVIHHKGVLREESSKKLEILRGFEPLKAIELTDIQIFEVIDEVKATLDGFVVWKGGPDPQHRFHLYYK